MQYSYSVSADGFDISPSTSYHRTPESAEGAVVKLLRAGQPVVRVSYRRHPLLTFTADPAFIPADGERVVSYPAWFLLTGEEGFNARQQAWIDSGRPTNLGGEPLFPRLDPPSISIRAAVTALGDVEPLPRGRAKRAAVSVLMERCGLSQRDAVAAVEALKEQLR